MKPLEVRFVHGYYGLSARRLYEATEFGQVNVFGHPLNVHHETDDAAKFIDVVRFHEQDSYLAGFTLAELISGKVPAVVGVDAVGITRLFEVFKKVRAWKNFLESVHRHLVQCSERQGIRNLQAPFLSAPSTHDCFGIRHIYSHLQTKLRALAKSKANAQQWIRTIEKFQKKGLRAEELEMSNIFQILRACKDPDQQFTGLELANCCVFDPLRISVIPVVSEAKQQLQFSGASGQALKKSNDLPKPQNEQIRKVAGFDPVLGYRIEQVEHTTLWGKETHWQAVFHDGVVIQDEYRKSLFSDRGNAEALAQAHARQYFPKQFALGKFGNYAWTGGESYREWLITLPYHPANYIDGHYSQRNVLAHIRCDVRDGADGERILMLQEVQSDWAQSARRAIRDGAISSDDAKCPPLIKEWIGLAIKLMLLHAAENNFDALAWTQGSQQVERYEGLGEGGLISLYDHAIPREVNRLLKHLGVTCETLSVFVPTNFSIRQSEFGYEVYSPDDELLGTALTLADAREFVPDQPHELLLDVHGVIFNPSFRGAILKSGFPLWG